MKASKQINTTILEHPSTRETELSQKQKENALRCQLHLLFFIKNDQCISAASAAGNHTEHQNPDTK